MNIGQVTDVSGGFEREGAGAALRRELPEALPVASVNSGRAALRLWSTSSSSTGTATRFRLMHAAMQVVHGLILNYS